MNTPTTTTTHLKLKSHQVSKVTEHTFIIETDSGTYHYKEWWNEHGVVIDSTLRDSEGHDIQDEDLCNEIQELIFSKL